ncbi:MAG: glycosyltransferase family 4 protein [Clostridia bacterium]|nr:glycosyltransferase family 4 protein [Clostridia bacterium]
MTPYKVILAHPGKQHSYRSAMALKKGGIDLTYITTVYYKERSLTKFASQVLKNDNFKRAVSRICPELEDSQVKQFCELDGLITLLLLRLDKSKKIYRWWNDRTTKRFGKKVARYAIKHQADMVITYDTNAQPCFHYLIKKSSDILRVMDISTAARPYTKAIYEEDMEKTGLNGLRKTNSFLWNPEREAYFSREIQETQYFLCPSIFVQKGLLYCNVKKDQIFRVPYGVQLEKFRFAPRKEHTGPLRLVYTGEVDYRKGFHHLLNVIERFSEDELELTLFGNYDADDAIIQRAMKKRNLHFKGFVLQEQLFDEYDRADLYVFPSLIEGLSLSILEAMACGLPVLISDHSGANDLIEQRKNGVVFEVGDDDALERELRWFMANRSCLMEMGQAACETVQSFSWNAYYHNYAKTVLALLDGRA